MLRRLAKNQPSNNASENTKNRDATATRPIFFLKNHQLQKFSDEKSKNHEDYNMIAIYETIREKRFEEVQKIRKLEKEEALRRGGWLGEPTDEYTSTIFSHLKLLTLKDGRLAVFACNADGEEEKFAFNERTERYEVLEDVVEVEDRPSNYLLRII